MDMAHHTHTHTAGGSRETCFTGGCGEAEEKQRGQQITINK